jgi:outer membrane murein-binding lipoprotein Lpp
MGGQTAVMNTRSFTTSSAPWTSRAAGLLMVGMASFAGGCTFVSDSLWPSLAGEDEAGTVVREAPPRVSRLSPEAQAARNAALNAAATGSASTTSFPSTQVAGGPPPLGTTTFEAPAVSSFPATGTVVGQKVQQLASELRQLEGRLNQRNDTLAQIRGSTIQNAQRYHGTVAAIQARLQVGSTPGNPVLVNQWNQAQSELTRLSSDIAAMNGLANEVAADSSLAAFLLETARATYGIAGAIDEDHRQLAVLEDQTNKTVVVIDRLLNELSDDVSRQTAYIANERRNLGSLALAIKNGELYGTSLASRAYAPPTSGYQPTGLQAPRAGNPGSAAVASGRPLVVIRFDRQNVEYEQALYTAVSRALDQRPDARFDIVAVSPSSGSAADIALQRSRSRKHADDVLRTLTGMGLPADRVGLTSTTSAEAGASEVHIYVR